MSRRITQTLLRETRPLRFQREHMQGQHRWWKSCGKALPNTALERVNNLRFLNAKTGWQVCNGDHFSLGTCKLMSGWQYLGLHKMWLWHHLGELPTPETSFSGQCPKCPPPLVAAQTLWIVRNGVSEDVVFTNTCLRHLLIIGWQWWSEPRFFNLVKL